MYYFNLVTSSELKYIFHRFGRRYQSRSFWFCQMMQLTWCFAETRPIGGQVMFGESIKRQWWHVHWSLVFGDLHFIDRGTAENFSWNPGLSWLLPADLCWFGGGLAASCGPCHCCWFMFGILTLLSWIAGNCPKVLLLNRSTSLCSVYYLFSPMIGWWPKRGIKAFENPFKSRFLKI